MNSTARVFMPRAGGRSPQRCATAPRAAAPQSQCVSTDPYNSPPRLASRQNSARQATRPPAPLSTSTHRLRQPSPATFRDRQDAIDPVAIKQHAPTMGVVNAPKSAAALYSSLLQSCIGANAFRQGKSVHHRAIITSSASSPPDLHLSTTGRVSRRSAAAAPRLVHRYRL